MQEYSEWAIVAWVLLDKICEENQGHCIPISSDIVDTAPLIAASSMEI